MPINTLTISQDNKAGGSNLMSIHNPLAFVCDAFYSGQAPSFIFVDVLIDGVSVALFRAIPYKDLTGTLRQFIFQAADLIRGVMFSGVPFDDIPQAAGTFEFVENLTKEITIKFSDPDGVASDVTTDVVVCSAASQWGDASGANLTDLFNNTTKIYYVAKGGRGYVYFYNDDESNIISINAPLETNYAIDSNNDIFTDSNNDRFLTL